MWRSRRRGGTLGCTTCSRSRASSPASPAHPARRSPGREALGGSRRCAARPTLPARRRAGARRPQSRSRRSGPRLDERAEAGYEDGETHAERTDPGKDVGPDDARSTRFEEEGGDHDPPWIRGAGDREEEDGWQRATQALARPRIAASYGAGAAYPEPSWTKPRRAPRRARDRIASACSSSPPRSAKVMWRLRALCPREFSAGTPRPRCRSSTCSLHSRRCFAGS